MTNNTSVDISNRDFAAQVRSERLHLIWKITIWVGIAMLWLLILFGNINQGLALLPTLSLIVGSLLCNYFLKRNELEVAVWALSLGMLGSTAGVLLWYDAPQVEEFMPYTTIPILYIAGLMLPARSLIPLTGIASAIILVAPWLNHGLDMPSVHTVVAIALLLVTALITAQASGELYGIAEWALESYRRERASANSLYESRQAVERSLLRQRALTTELESTNDALGEARRAAEEAKHFRGQFLANMSHELRTPLNAVIGFSETMLNFPPMYNNIELPEAYRADLSQINNSGKHLLNIINDILDLSKIDAGRLEVDIQEVDLEPIFKGVLSTAVGLVGGKPIKLQRDLPEHIPHVKGDPVRVRQVLLNLYSNAAKFTESGTITLLLDYDDKVVTIGVKDTGEGVPPENMELIFEEFRQAAAGRKKARAGAGLGLAISRQLLSMMEGNIWAESKYGQGSTFYFSLPRADAEATNDESTPHAAPVAAE